MRIFRRSPMSFMSSPSRRTGITLALATTLAMSVAPAASADDLATTTGGTGSMSSLEGVANIPTLRTIFPGASPYSDSTENNVVTFGDSFTANSHWLVNDYPVLAAQYPRQAGCLTAPDAWPAMLGVATGRPVQNWACNAHTTSQMLGRIDQAIAAGHVNDSSLVVLAAGMNDKRRGVSDEQVVKNLVAGVEKVQHGSPEGADRAAGTPGHHRRKRGVLFDQRAAEPSDRQRRPHHRQPRGGRPGQPAKGRRRGQRPVHRHPRHDHARQLHLRTGRRSLCLRQPRLHDPRVQHECPPLDRRQPVPGRTDRGIPRSRRRRADPGIHRGR